MKIRKQFQLKVFFNKSYDWNKMTASVFEFDTCHICRTGVHTWLIVINHNRYLQIGLDSFLYKTKNEKRTYRKKNQIFFKQHWNSIPLWICLPFIVFYLFFQNTVFYVLKSTDFRHFPLGIWEIQMKKPGNKSWLANTAK